MNLFLAAPLSLMKATEGWSASRAGRAYHGGVDLRIPVGTPVFASSGGTVVRAGPYSDTPGLSVELDHGDGMLTRYLHLSRLDVKAGQRVSRGQRLGLSGFATTPHLHWDSWVALSKLPEYVRTFGAPTTGFAVKQTFGGKVWVKVPAEPLAPMGYEADVIAAAKATGVKLYSMWRNPMILVGLVGILGVGAYWYFGRPALPPSTQT
jgi:murein DD-endopeptidase MepM/ murein hydrolase activator NlpD